MDASLLLGTESASGAAAAPAAAAGAGAKRHCAYAMPALVMGSCVQLDGGVRQLRSLGPLLVCCAATSCLICSGLAIPCDNQGGFESAE